MMHIMCGGAIFTQLRLVLSFVSCRGCHLRLQECLEIIFCTVKQVHLIVENIPVNSYFITLHDKGEVDKQSSFTLGDYRSINWAPVP